MPPTDDNFKKLSQLGGLLLACNVGNAPQQIVGRDRRMRVSHHDWSGGGWVKSRRRVNSTVGWLALF
jgi:hypothetical protein